MKEIPEKLDMTPVLFADGAKGAAMQQHFNAEYGLTMTASRASRDAEWVRTFRVEGLDGEWETVAELNEAIREAK